MNGGVNGLAVQATPATDTGESVKPSEIMSLRVLQDRTKSGFNIFFHRKQNAKVRASSIVAAAQLCRRFAALPQCRAQLSLQVLSLMVISPKHR